ncbi:hypothetical protein [Sphingobacterium spiritivorum]|uniref:hypothetical protein n=1 Tax=Sphingobacterium spiritivorum TaxID=258 RepID=UPI0019188283|nr:hypothetical protein [Sphingobacterium spiritivorum]QQT27642.1 hypothetical protein I6J02_07305 [Sphingobacterium spiritivorum]
MEKEFIPIEDRRVYFLFRRGKREHIEALFNTGEVYINSVDFIRNCDNNWERSNEEDGIHGRNYLGEGKVILCEIGGDFDKDGTTFDAKDILIRHDNLQKGNIYCLTGIYSEHFSGNRNEIRFETQSFGDTVIFIHKPKVFIDRISKALTDLGYSSCISNKVNYYANNYSGGVGLFRKHEKFKHQQEFRIFVPNDRVEPIKLQIGPLNDIAQLGMGVLKLKYTDDKEQLIYL